VFEFHPELARLLSAIVDSSDDAIVSKDLDGIVTSWNRSAQQMFGWTAEEMIGRSIRTIIPTERWPEEDNVLASIRRGEKVDHFETERVAKDGSRIQISLTVSPILDDSGKVVGASKIARDISEAKRVREQLDRARRREAFLGDVTTVLASSLNHERTLQTVAELAVPRLGDWCAFDLVNEQDELVHVAMASSSPREGSPGVPYDVQQVIASRESVLIPAVTNAMVEEFAAGDPERLAKLRGLVSFLIVPIVSRDRAIGTLTLATAESGVHYTDDDVWFAEEVANRAGLAIDNSRAYQQAEEANRLKDEFLATLSHELRTPLNAVMGYARMLKSGAITPERTPQALDTIDRNAAALTQIVEDVLDISRIVTGKTSLEVQPLDPEKLLRDAIATVMPAIEAKGIRLQTRMDAHVGRVSADPDRLQQVMWNLLSNAVKFTPAGGRVVVSLERVDSQVEITVADNGIGISPDFLPHIFERFRQAESGPSRRHGGLGLGLSIARHLIEMHGGSLVAASEGERKGSTFRVRLPLMMPIPERQPPERQKEHSRVDRASIALDLPDLTGIRVLAVDDDADALRLLCDILEAAGAAVVTVSSAQAALQKLASERPQVIVADLAMPGMDGFELIKHVRELADPSLSGIPAAALTAYARSGDRAKSLRGGFEVHLAKPIDPVELVAAVSALVRRH
jgi:PAS domain S-box-containing protein